MASEVLTFRRRIFRGEAIAESVREDAFRTDRRLGRAVQIVFGPEGDA
jgi:hypothetical protein